MLLNLLICAIYYAVPLKKETGDSYTGDRRKITWGFAPPSNA
ncbi:MULTISPECIES: hypothetical protein [unclassified Okeania]|nr:MULTISPECIES: hypothetical protein [unclassified Okeania]